MKSFSSKLNIVGFLALFSICLTNCLALAAGNERVLIVYERVVEQDNEVVPEKVLSLQKLLTHELGCDVRLSTYNSPGLALFDSGKKTVDNLVLFPVKRRIMSDAESFNQYAYLDFINDKGNILVVDDAGHFLFEPARLLLNEAGIYASPKGYQYFDHSKEIDGIPHISNKNVVHKSFRDIVHGDKPYTGKSAMLSSSPLVFPIVRGSKTSFTSSELKGFSKEDKIWSFGEQSYLAAGLQTLSNSRVSWIGSSDLISKELLKWTFQQKDALKLQFTKHHNARFPEEPSPKLYKVTDTVIFEAALSKLENGQWVPYEVPENDSLQISFEMLDPYQRINMTGIGPVSSTSDADLDSYLYSASFKVPDQHGMFTFNLEYKRPGLSFIENKEVVVVRHLANDEYKRSWEITNSWLYIACASLVISGWFIFTTLFLFLGKHDSEKKDI